MHLFLCLVLIGAILYAIYSSCKHYSDLDETSIQSKSDFEIERKFLVDPKKVPFAAAKSITTMKQGYIAQENGTAVRVRMTDKGAFLTTKSKTDGELTRHEVEFGISSSNAIKLLKLSQGYIIEKKRYVITYNEQDFEVDVFEGANSGLILAELEMSSEDQNVDLPDWILEDVSTESRYFNSYLSSNPFGTWS